MAAYTFIEKIVSFLSQILIVLMISYHPLFSNVELELFSTISSLIWLYLWVFLEGLIFEMQESKIKPTISRLFRLMLISQLLICVNIKSKNENMNILQLFICNFIKIFGHTL